METFCRTCDSAPAPGDHLRGSPRECKACWAYRDRTGRQRPQSLIAKAAKRHAERPEPAPVHTELDTPEPHATAMTREAYYRDETEVPSCSEEWCFEAPYGEGPLCKRHTDLAWYRRQR